MAKQSRVVLTRSKAAKSTKESTHEHYHDDGAQDIADVVNRQSFSTARHPNEESPYLEKSTLTSILTGSWFKTKQPAPSESRLPSAQTLIQQLSDPGGSLAQRARLSIGSPKGLSSPEELSHNTPKRVEKGRSSGRADPYEVPDSPIRAVGEGRVRKPQQGRRGPKPRPKDQPGKITKKGALVNTTRVSKAAEELVEPEETEHGLAKQIMLPRSRRYSGNFVIGNTIELPKRMTGANVQVSGVSKASRLPMGTRRKPKSTKVEIETGLEDEEPGGEDPDMESQEEEELDAKMTASRRDGHIRQTEGVSSILMNPTPSPINIIRPIPAQSIRAQPDIPDLDLESQSDIDGVEGTLRESRQITVQSKPGYSFISKAIIDQMLSSFKKHPRRNNDEICSTLGRRMVNCIEYLRKRYNILELRSQAVMDVEKIERECQGGLKKLGEMALEVLKSKLGDRSEGGNNAREDLRQNMAIDLHTHILPGLVKVLKIMAKLDQSNEEIMRLVKLLNKLSNAALGMQSKAPKQPTKKLLKVVSKLHDELMEKARIEEARRMAPERIRKRKEQMELKAREEEKRFRQRQEEINVANWVSLNNTRAQLGLPPCLPEVQERASSQRPTETLGERGRSNLHPASRKRVWSKFEMETLIEGLRQEHGKPFLQYHIIRRILLAIFVVVLYLMSFVTKVLQVKAGMRELLRNWIGALTRWLSGPDISKVRWSLYMRRASRTTQEFGLPH
jgi:hypothetical protein